MTADQIISKVWSFCHVLRDAGVSYVDYLEQLTFLIFLKMADEYSNPIYKKEIDIPKKYSWPQLRKKRGAELESLYLELLQELGKGKGMLGHIFTKAQNKIQDPAMLYKVIDMIDKENWVTDVSTDVKGKIYEGLLEKNAEDTKSGAGQYFTPRALIKAIVECVRPEPKKSIADPACGTGGFFLAAYDFVAKQKLDKAQKDFLKHQTFHGNEIVPNTRRLALMNMFLHNIGEIDGEPAIDPTDALIAAPKKTFDYVLTNPPFGKKSSYTSSNGEGKEEKEDFTYNRQDFWATTSNKQLNFVQHVRTMLKSTGKAAVVVPDNVLFEGGAGETVRKKLLENTELHTILRLPTGVFYAQGVKANVLFFDNREASKDPWTKEVWFYDYRTNIHHTLKKKQLRFEDLQDFVDCYNPSNRHARKATWDEKKNPEGRWRKFTYKEIVARDKTSLDIFWLKDKSLADLDNLPEPEILAEEIIENLEAGLASFRAVAAGLASRNSLSVTDKITEQRYHLTENLTER
ncbi:MAG: type I restriction-modification system subunit M [Desulfobulbaceae bacterium]|nr:type I restriction-modification system subunit M [Desulfobulbaceae bacterium]